MDTTPPAFLVEVFFKEFAHFPSAFPNETMTIDVASAMAGHHSSKVDFQPRSRRKFPAAGRARKA